MRTWKDQEVLREYTEKSSESAFAELVRRYVDLVYSAALRIVRDGRSAEDVSQAVFLALARSAAQLQDRPVLAGWLHRTTHNLAANTVRGESRRRFREQEAAIMNQLTSTTPDAVWETLGPELDAALAELADGDREAVLLRYFQRKSAREMAETFGTSEEAAQKRLNRAVERLRDLLTKRGITVGASAMVLAISTHAVIAAPIALAGTITAAAATLGAAALSSSTAIAAKTIVMTTFQKTLVAAVLATSIGVAVHQTRKASDLRAQIQMALTGQTQQPSAAPDASEITRLSDALSNATDQIDNLNKENMSLKRAAVYRLTNRVTQVPYGPGPNYVSHFIGSVPKGTLEKVARLKDYLRQTPNRFIPEIQYLSDNQWLEVVRDRQQLESDDDFRRAASAVRAAAKGAFALRLSQALGSYAKDHGQQLPNDISELKDYLNNQTDRPGPGFLARKYDPPVDDALLQRYQMVRSGSVEGLEVRQPLIAEKAAVDEGMDSLYQVAIDGYAAQGTGDNKMTASASWGAANRDPQNTAKRNDTNSYTGWAASERMSVESEKRTLEFRVQSMTNDLSAEQVEAYRSKKLEGIQKAEEATALLRSFGK